MFFFIYNLIPDLKQKQNRLTIAKSKLTAFAKGEEEKKILLKWKNNEDEKLKEFEMTIGQKWSAVVKAFTMTSLSIEEKEALFEALHKEDPSDTAKKHRHTCDSLKAGEEEFEKIYESFKDKNNTQSVSVKESIAAGWAHPYHKERLLKYRERFFKDLQELIPLISIDHYECFYDNLSPIDDDLEFQIAAFSKIKFPAGRDKNERDILKMIDNLKRRHKAYQMYANPNLWSEYPNSY